MYAHTKRVVLEVAAVIALWCIVGELLILIFMGVNSAAMLGLLLGSGIGIAAFIHMAVSLENTLDLADEELARKNNTKTFITRTVVIAVVLILAVLSGWFNMLFIIFGMFSLKIGAYVQPLVDKIFSKHT